MYKPDSDTVNLPSKEEIITQARQGVFNNNPLLVNPHEVECKNCKRKNRVIYLDFLKSGQFKIGETRKVDVLQLDNSFGGLNQIQENITPLILKKECKQCGTKNSWSPINLEYLLFAKNTQKNPNQLYI
jgi:hypothetical protein